MENKSDIRSLCLTMLVNTLSKGHFSHLQMNEVLEVNNLSARDRAFLSRLYFGTLEHILFLDYLIDCFSNTKTGKMKPVIVNILRMGIYQLLFMDAVPDHAAINEAVRLAKKRGFGSLRPFVNGVLRSVQRGPLPEIIPEHIRFSVPEWLYRKMVKDYGKERAEGFFKAVNEPSSAVHVRMNLKDGKAQQIIDSLEKDGCKVIRADIEEAIAITGFERLTELHAFKEGLIFVQDYSSANIAVMAAKYSNTTKPYILDLCAAPGGKSLHLAEKFPEGFVDARDISIEKINLLNNNIQRMKAKNIMAKTADATVFDPRMEGKADILVADLPCSGLGVIGKKPDIKLRVKEQDLKALVELQRTVLSVSAAYVKKGGILIYSTCTLNKQENEENSFWFSREFHFEKMEERTFIPGVDRCDGFYLCVLRK